MPAVAAGAVTVASSTTSKVSWTDVDGNGEQVGVAPGALIDAALAAVP